MSDFEHIGKILERIDIERKAVKEGAYESPSFDFTKMHHFRIMVDGGDFLFEKSGGGLYWSVKYSGMSNPIMIPT